MRGLAYKRFQREKHIKRKENILRRWRRDNPPHEYDDKDTIVFRRECPNFKKIDSSKGDWYPFYIKNYRGQLSKGKIHCSCSICSAKTNKIPFMGTYGRIGRKNYCISDLRRVLGMNWDKIHGEEEEELIKFDNWLNS